MKFTECRSLPWLTEETIITKDYFTLTKKVNDRIYDVLELKSLMTESEKDDYYMVVNLFDFMTADTTSFIFDTDREIVHLFNHANEILDNLQESMLDRLDSIVLLCKTGK